MTPEHRAMLDLCALNLANLARTETRPAQAMCLRTTLQYIEYVAREPQQERVHRVPRLRVVGGRGL
jgi:hypothetical protein